MTARTTMAVLVPSRRPHDLRRCLRSVVEQLAEDDELLVVHDAADRESPAVALNLCRTAVVVRVTKLDYPAAVTAGVRASRADAIAVLEDNMVPMNGWLKALRDQLRRSPSTGAVGGPVLTFRGARTTNSFSEGAPLEQVARLGQPHDPLREIPTREWKEETDFLARGNIAFRRKLFDHCDLSRLEDMSPAVEWHLAQMVRRRGLHVVYDSRIRVEQHFPPGEPSRLDRQRAARDLGYSATVILGDTSGRIRRLPALGRWMFVGSLRSPGFLPAGAAVLRGRGSRVCLAAAHGRLLGLLASLRPVDKA